MCDGILVTERYFFSLINMLYSKLEKPIQRILVTDVLYINGLSLRSLPYSKRCKELYKEIVERVKMTREKDMEAIQQSPYQSIGMRDFWPLKSLQKIMSPSFIQSLTHESEGIVILDPNSSYTFGDEASRMWKFIGDPNTVSN